MHDRLFAGSSAGEWGRGDEGDMRTFLGYAQALGLDVAELTRCVSDNRYASQIEADFRDGVDHGVRSTPSFLVNGKPLVGAHPFSTWQQVLDGMLPQS